MKGESLRKETLEGEFDALLRSVKPDTKLFSIAGDMLEGHWEIRRKTHSANKQAQIEDKKSKLVDRIVETDSISLLAAYGSSLHKLEEQKALLASHINNTQDKFPEFNETFRTAMEFLEGPYNIWASGDIALKRATLKMVFPHYLTYTLK
jgi:hypothetical protein